MTVQHADLFTWRLDDGDEASLWPLLSDDEKERADRYRFAHHRAGFIASRGRVRSVLAAYAGLAPAALAFAYGEHGKPALAQRPDMVFNFSDTGAWGCLVVAPAPAAGPVGVDIEVMRPRDWLKITERFFSPAEHARMQALAQDDLAPAFFRGWTRKEAFLKAVGTGLSTRLDAFEVTLLPEEDVRMTRIDPAIAAGAPQDWALAQFQPAGDVMGAIALKTGGAAMGVSVRDYR